MPSVGTGVVTVERGADEAHEGLARVGHDQPVAVPDVPAEGQQPDLADVWDGYTGGPALLARLADPTLAFTPARPGPRAVWAAPTEAPVRSASDRTATWGSTRRSASR